MKHLKFLFGLISLSFLSTTSAQFFQTPNPPGRYMDNHPLVHSVGIGNFGGATLPQSVFHVNSNLTTVKPGLSLGDIFQTTGPTNLNNSWRMFTGTGNGIQSFSLTTLSNFGGIRLTTFQNQYMEFHTNNVLRMHINGDVSAINQGFVGIGTNFNAPQSRLHINEFDPSPPC